jgi:hypothetical protein
MRLLSALQVLAIFQHPTTIYVYSVALLMIRNKLNKVECAPQRHLLPSPLGVQKVAHSSTFVISNNASDWQQQILQSSSVLPLKDGDTAAQHVSASTDMKAADFQWERSKELLLLQRQKKSSEECSHQGSDDSQ